MKKFLLIPILLLINLSAGRLIPGETKTYTQFANKKILKSNNSLLSKKEENKLKLFLRIPRLIKKINTDNALSRNNLGYKKRISSLLKRAVKLSDNKSEIKYLNSLSEDIIKMRFNASLSDWLELQDNIVEIILYKEQKSRKLVGFIWINQKFQTGIISQLSDNLDKIMSKSGWVNSFFRVTPDLLSPFLLSNLIYPENHHSYNMVYPTKKLIKKQFYFKTIYFQNIMKETFNKNIKPVSNTVFPKGYSEKVDFEAFLSYKIIHRVSHYLGPIILLGKSKEIEFINKKLKDLFYPIEEVRAEALTFVTISILSDEKVFDEKLEKRLQYTMFANLINSLKYISDNDFKDPNLILFNYLLKNESVKYDINKKQLSLSAKKTKKNMKSLLAKMTKIAESGNYQEAEKFLNNYSYIPDNLKEIKEIMAKTTANVIKDKSTESAQKQQ